MLWPPCSLARWPLAVQRGRGGAVPGPRPRAGHSGDNLRRLAHHPGVGLTVMGVYCMLLAPPWLLFKVGDPPTPRRKGGGLVGSIASCRKKVHCHRFFGSYFCSSPEPKNTPTLGGWVCPTSNFSQRRFEKLLGTITLLPFSEKYEFTRSVIFMCRWFF